jgi:type II secretory pathway pseudopilin PulG
MLIISVMMGIAVVRLPNVTQSAELIEQSDRLLTLMNMAVDEAIIGGKELGFDYAKNEYHFYRLESDSGKWQILEDPPFQSRELIEGVRLFMEVEGRSLKKDTPEKDSKAPRVMFLSSGESTPVTLIFTQPSRTDMEMVITSDGFNGFVIEDPQEQLSRSFAGD